MRFTFSLFLDFSVFPTFYPRMVLILHFVFLFTDTPNQILSSVLLVTQILRAVILHTVTLLDIFFFHASILKEKSGKCFSPWPWVGSHRRILDSFFFTLFLPTLSSFSLQFLLHFSALPHALMATQTLAC